MSEQLGVTARDKGTPRPGFCMMGLDRMGLWGCSGAYFTNGGKNRISWTVGLREMDISVDVPSSGDVTCLVSP